MYSSCIKLNLVLTYIYTHIAIKCIIIFVGSYIDSHTIAKYIRIAMWPDLGKGVLCSHLIFEF